MPVTEPAEIGQPQPETASAGLERYHRAEAVCEMFGGISRTTLWSWVKIGKLPAPYELGPNCRGWADSELRKAQAELKRVSWAPPAEKAA